MHVEKIAFLQETLFQKINLLQAHTPSQWGVMDARQMLEHLAMFFDVSYQKLSFPLAVPQEHLPKYKQFLYSDKPFRENTKAPATLLGDEPLPYQFDSIEKAKENLAQSVNGFFAYFHSHPQATTMHPVFGDLNFEEWVLLHSKHVTHHLRQFGLQE